MIALYHLASGATAEELPGVGEALSEAGLSLPGKVSRAVLVGQTISPSAPMVTDDGLYLHALWGRLAYQLGGREGYELVRTDDEHGTNPGSALETVFERYGPAVVLIDEWVAYARQLRDGGDGDRLAGGDFDTQFTFAQFLTEAAAAVPNVVLLVSIPASDIEVGGHRGKEALEKLKNVVTRKAAQWQPASPDESFEIVRRRLFDPIPGDRAKIRDGVIRAFSEMYRTQPTEFPSGTSEAEYRRRMELSYPIHPELFDRLFGDWSALDKFQRTRGVLRLMALAITAPKAALPRHLQTIRGAPTSTFSVLSAPSPTAHRARAGGGHDPDRVPHRRPPARGSSHRGSGGHRQRRATGFDDRADADLRDQIAEALPAIVAK